MSNLVDEIDLILCSLLHLDPEVKEKKLDMSKYGLINDNPSEAQAIFILKGFDCDYIIQKSPNGKREMILKW